MTDRGKYDVDQWCTTCGGYGMINVGNPGQIVMDTCTTCHGKQYDAWLVKQKRELRELKEREEKLNGQ